MNQKSMNMLSKILTKLCAIKLFWYFSGQRLIKYSEIYKNDNIEQYEKRVIIKNITRTVIVYK